MSEGEPSVDPRREALTTEGHRRSAKALGIAAATRWVIQRWPFVVVCTVFALSRLVYTRGLGITFDSSPFSYFIQYVDPWFIENDFWRTLFYLPHQAPLQNMLVGGTWRLLGEERAFIVLRWLYTALGLTLALATLQAMRRLGIKPIVAAIAVSLYAASPVSILYENWLFYHTPLAALLALSLVPLLRHYRLGTWKAGFAFFGLLATIALIRNIYGVVWMSAILFMLFVRPPVATATNPSPRRRLLAVAAIPILLVALNGWKTSLLIGKGFADSLVWTNLVAKTWMNIPKKERIRLEKLKIVSPSVRHEAFSALKDLPELRVPHEDTGVPLLDMPRSPSGRANLHTLEYLMIVDRYYKPDGKYLLRHYPEAYLEGVKSALTDWYVSSPSRDVTLIRTQNYKELRPIEGPIEKWLGIHGYGRMWALMIGLPLSFAYGAYRILRSRAGLPSERSAQAAMAFMLVTIGYVTLGTTLISYGDFSRYRYEIDSFYLILFVLCLSHATGFAFRTVAAISRRLRALVMKVATKLRSASPTKNEPKPGFG